MKLIFRARKTASIKMKRSLLSTGIFQNGARHLGTISNFFFFFFPPFLFFSFYFFLDASQTKNVGNKMSTTFIPNEKILSTIEVHFTALGFSHVTWKSLKKKKICFLDVYLPKMCILPFFYDYTSKSYIRSYMYVFLSY